MNPNLCRGLWVIVVCQCSFIAHKEHTLWHRMSTMREVVCVRGQGIHGSSLLSTQFCCEPTTTLKKSSLLIKKKEHSNRNNVRHRTSLRREFLNTLYLGKFGINLAHICPSVQEVQFFSIMWNVYHIYKGIYIYLNTRSVRLRYKTNAYLLLNKKVLVTWTGIRVLL